MRFKEERPQAPGQRDRERTPCPSSAQTKGSPRGQTQTTVMETNEARRSPLPEVTPSRGHRRVRQRPPLHSFLQNQCLRG